ncbi:hypothetical protein QOM18_01770 [Serratia marcescens]|uniref:hypothetical protein n=1 Tax=Serratia marcescens TaxID=615 RepID=UPI0024C4DAD5|nr:hypothetical protein [Serratia marcescens]MDK1707039.1 hypothetical protein [Serratia marcescens]
MINSESLVYIKIDKDNSLLFQLRDLSHVAPSNNDHWQHVNIFLREARCRVTVPVDMIVFAIIDIITQQYESIDTRYFFNIDFSECPNGAITKTKIG